jgi:hypothetical protein
MVFQPPRPPSVASDAREQSSAGRELGLAGVEPRSFRYIKEFHLSQRLSQGKIIFYLRNIQTLTVCNATGTEGGGFIRSILLVCAEILSQLDKLVISQLGLLAQRRLARGVKLNHAEATVKLIRVNCLPF